MHAFVTVFETHANRTPMPTCCLVVVVVDDAGGDGGVHARDEAVQDAPLPAALLLLQTAIPLHAVKLEGALGVDARPDAAGILALVAWVAKTTSMACQVG